MTHPNGIALGGDVGAAVRSVAPLSSGNVGGGSQLLSGAGVPATATGNNGDFYFRSDTPGTANQRIYVKSAGAWVGIV